MMNSEQRMQRLGDLMHNLDCVMHDECEALEALRDSPSDILCTIMTAATMFAAKALATTMLSRSEGTVEETLNKHAEQLNRVAMVEARRIHAASDSPTETTDLRHMALH